MGGRFPPLDRTQVESVLKKLGFTMKRQKGTSHAQWEGCVDGRRRIVTVDHLSGRKEKYGRRLLLKMIDQSGLTTKEFYKHIEK